MFDIIISFDNKLSIGPNSIPIYILKICNILLSDKLADHYTEYQYAFTLLYPNVI